MTFFLVEKVASIIMRLAHCAKGFKNNEKMFILLCWWEVASIMLCLARCAGGCKNNGKCVAPNQCSCKPGFSGSNCNRGRRDRTDNIRQDNIRQDNIRLNNIG